MKMRDKTSTLIVARGINAMWVIWKARPDGYVHNSYFISGYITPSSTSWQRLKFILIVVKMRLSNAPNASYSKRYRRFSD